MDKTLTGLTLIIAILVLLNWRMSFIFSRNYRLDWKSDLVELWQESKFFLKAQAIMLLLCICGQTCLNFYGQEELTVAAANFSPVAIATQLSQGLLPILTLFYVTSLGSKTNPVPMATIGIGAVFKYFIGDALKDTLAGIGLFFFVIPGFIVWYRTCLFLPAFAFGGRDIRAAWRQSLDLTQGKYWLISRYLSPVILVFLVSNLAHDLAQIIFVGVAAKTPGLADTALWHALVPIGFVGSAVSAAISIALELLISGLSYKLYARLSGKAETA